MKNPILILLVLYFNCSFAQDKPYARLVVDTLTSDNYAGRGYVNDGHNKAASFIAKEFERFGLERFDNDFKQEYQIDVNTFGGNADVLIDDNPLIVGVDFLVDPSCPSIKGTYDLLWLDHEILGNPKKMAEFISIDLSQIFLIVDTEKIEDNEKV